MSDHVSLERFVAYWANDADDAEVAAIDDHVFACDACARDSARIAAIAQGLRASIPPAISRAELDAFRARGQVVRENAFVPGVRAAAVFERGVDLLIHRLTDLALEDATRVDVVVRTVGGQPVFVDHFAPFDRARGEVLIACQRHFEAFGAEAVFDVVVHGPGGAAPTVATYDIPHVFV